MDFHKLACLERARAKAAEGSPESLRYACLELRFCIESICYDKLKLYAKHLPPELLNTWQPRKVVETLLEYDPNATSSYDLRVWMEEEAGNPQTLVFSGHHTTLSPAVLNRHYSKLGSFLHVPTPAQQKQRREVSAEELAKYLGELMPEVEAAASNAFDSNLAGVITFDCDECGQPVIRNTDSLKQQAEVVITCNNPKCRAQYSIRQDAAGYTRELRSADFTCAECGTKNYIRVHLLREDVNLTIACVGCRSKVVVSKEWVIRKVDAAAPNPTPAADG